MLEMFLIGCIASLVTQKGVDMYTPASIYTSEYIEGCGEYRLG